MSVYRTIGPLVNIVNGLRIGMSNFAHADAMVTATFSFGHL